MSPEDPVATLERWVDSGADYRVISLTDDHAVVELRTCLGEPEDRLESSDPRFLEWLSSSCR